MHDTIVRSAQVVSTVGITALILVDLGAACFGSVPYLPADLHQFLVGALILIAFVGFVVPLLRRVIRAEVTALLAEHRATLGVQYDDKVFLGPAVIDEMRAEAREAGFRSGLVAGSCESVLPRPRSLRAAGAGDN